MLVLGKGRIWTQPRFGLGLCPEHAPSLLLREDTERLWLKAALYLQLLQLGFNYYFSSVTYGKTKRKGGEKERREGERNTHANTLTQRREKSHTIPVGMSQALQPKATAQHKSMVVFGRDEPTPVSLFILLHRVCQED